VTEERNGGTNLCERRLVGRALQTEPACTTKIPWGPDFFRDGMLIVTNNRLVTTWPTDLAH
jgi:hypothetical protein